MSKVGRQVTVSGRGRGRDVDSETLVQRWCSCWDGLPMDRVGSVGVSLGGGGRGGGVGIGQRVRVQQA